MARLPIPGSDDGSWGDILNAYLLQSLAADGSIRTGVVGSPQLADNAVTSAKLAPSAVTTSHLSTGSVTNSAIADGAIAQGKIANLSGDLAGKASSVHTHTASQISDASTAGRSLMTAADAAAQRSALGLGSVATLTVGTTTGTVAAGDDSRITGAQSAATLDADVAALVGDGGSSVASLLSSTFAPWRGARPGNRIALITSSSGRGVYDGDSEPGIGGATAYTAGNSWLTWASALSGGRIQRFRNASVIGDTLTLMAARLDTDVIAHRPASCIVMGGYNDAYNSVTPASYIATLTSIVNRLRAAGIVPILGTPLTTANDSTIAALIEQYARQVRHLASIEGITLLDFHQWVIDPTTGGLRTEVSTGGDGVHPGAAGQKWLGQRVADVLGPQLPTTATGLQITPLDTSNLIPNGWFTGSTTDGRAPSVSQSLKPTGTTFSVVTDSEVPGSMQRIAVSATASTARLFQRINRSGSNWSAGDLLEFSGVVTSDGGARASVMVEFNTAPYGQQPLLLTQAATRAYYCARIRIPTPMPFDYIDVRMQVEAGTGTVDFGQLTVRNLTTAGMDA